MPVAAQRSGTRSAKAFDLSRYLDARTAEVNPALDRFLPKESARPATIHRAMRHSLFAGGKRMRPALCLAAAEACGSRVAEALPLACAVECIHTYSLIHDDLPAMDNDDFRRGTPRPRWKVLARRGILRRNSRHDSPRHDTMRHSAIGPLDGVDDTGGTRTR